MICELSVAEKLIAGLISLGQLEETSTKKRLYLTCHTPNVSSMKS